MTIVQSRTEKKTVKETVDERQDDGKIKQVEKNVEKTVLYITVSYRDLESMMNRNCFTDEQKEMCRELLKDENNALWSAVLNGVAYSQLSNCDDEDLREQIQEQINACQNQLNRCYSEKEDFENELRNIDNKKNQLQQQLNFAKSEKASVESELSKEKNKCNKLKNKLDRLKTAYSRVESDMSAYVSATKHFETASSDSTQSNLSSVDLCISSIEDYLSVSL